MKKNFIIGNFIISFVLVLAMKVIIRKLRKLIITN